MASSYIVSDGNVKLSCFIVLSQYSISLQASVGSKILARSDIKPIRKDVAAKLYGGDLSRKMKLLKHQAEGKKAMKAVGKVRVPKQAYISLLKHT